MRIVFMGTPEFAVPSLEILVENNYQIVGVVTAPDKPAGRGNQLQISEIKKVALAHGLPLLQPTNLKSEEFLSDLKALKADLQIIVAFRMLPEAVWSMPKLGTFNLHASLLPKYRGAAPINWAIIRGEKETGLSTFFLQHEIDTGNIIFQETEPIHFNDTAGSLYERLMKKGAGLVLKTVQAIRQANVLVKPQQGEVTHAPKIFRETCQINWNQPVSKIYDFVRGLAPYPGAWTMLQEKNCKIFQVSPSLLSLNQPGSIGEMYCNQDLIAFRALDGWAAVEILQLEGKKRMEVKEFLKGFKMV